MTPLSLLLTFLAVTSVDNAWGAPMCNNQCCRFVEGFPVRLRALREDFSQIRDYYEANDDVDTALLDESVENYFKSPFGCHAMDNILDFYLRTIFPTAMSKVPENNSMEYKSHMESIQQIFADLKSDVIRCRHYFSCKKPFDITHLTSTYTQMQDKGVFKAIGELDLLLNYIEIYLASKRRQ